ncbi:Zeatin O-xylosyltransferase [Capsicum baccatum]|uniref:Zeatin O-xylosyltransferase n=1 Tax=Capsicum baccatum TaxID=33114 RepID=A0A2G2X9C9_CAPBA|nr:Zeatin O-xylosyltransferase [Capsicum baccatum]
MSFGMTTSLCDEEINALVVGLEKSHQKFIWVLRDTNKGDVFTAEVRKVQFPEGYEERIKERGIIARRGELVTSEIVDNAVKTLMASAEGDMMRERAADLSNAIKKSVMDEGINHAEKDSFIAHITR